MHVDVPHSLLKDLNTMSLVWNISATEIVRRSLKAHERTAAVLSKNEETTVTNMNWKIETDLEGWEVVAAVQQNVDEHREELNKELSKPVFMPTELEGVHYKIKSQKKVK